MQPGASIELRELELLVVVADTGSLGQAAARYRMSQPAVSMRMTNLERALGLRLLHRGTSGTTLTPAGAQIVTAARAVLSAVDRLAETASSLRAESSSRLRLAASFTVAEYLAPAWIEALRSDHPQVALALEVENSAQVLAAVRQGRAEVGFVEGPDEQISGTESEPVATDALVVVVSPGHPWARRRRAVSAEELANTELVVRERGSGTREVLETALKPWGGVRTHLELGSSAAILASALREGGPAVLSALAARAMISSGELCPVEVTGLDLRRTIRAIWAAGTSPGPLAQRLLAAAQAQANLKAGSLAKP